MQVKIPANKPYFTEKQRAEISFEITKILESGRLTQGPWVRRFEDAFAEYIGAKYAVATNSGTSALEILLRYYDVRDREVIIPTNTFLATGNAIVFAGGKPMLADISAETLSIDPANIERRLTSKSKGVIIVHIAGVICPQVHEIREFCMKKGLFLIEDAAHAPGASIDDHKAGVLSDGGAFSFYPTKPMTTGEGGMITTNDADCEHFARSARSHGISISEENSRNKNLLVRLGYNWRMSELQAVVGYHQLQNLDEAISLRNEIARIYERELKDIPGIKLFNVPDGIQHSYYKYPILLDKQLSGEQTVKRLKEQFEIQAGSIYWPPCHLQPFYKENFGYKMGDYPVAEDILSRTIALPIFPQMTEREVLTVSEAISEITANVTEVGLAKT